MNEVQDREKDDEKLFVKVYLSFFVYGIQVYSVMVLYNSICSSYSPCPIDFIKARMKIFNDEHEELLVVLVELNHREQDVKEGVVPLFSPLIYLGHLLVVDNRRVVPFIVIEDNYGPIYPYRKVVDEVLLFIS
jgi:hypothetical protein